MENPDDSTFFERLDRTAEELKTETARLAHTKHLFQTITCGELDTILEQTREATAQLKRVVTERRGKHAS